MKKLAAGLLGLTLAACASAPSPYEPQNYQTMAWAKKSFDENKAYCRYKAMRRTKDKILRLENNEIDVTHFKACMESKGYHYVYGSDIDDNANALRLSPPQPEADKSALYR